MRELCFELIHEDVLLKDEQVAREARVRGRFASCPIDDLRILNSSMIFTKI